MKILGIDIGGTFTDLYLVDNVENEQTIHKVSTTPEDPSTGALTGITELCEATGTAPGAIDYVLHGTTIATNAVLESDGVETGMLTTENYRDITHIGRHQRPQNYSIQQEIPWQDDPLVERRHRKTVPERIVPPDGEVEVPLDEAAVEEAATELRADGVDAVAICFLFSYLEAEHEQRAREIVEAVHPDAYVTTSSSVHPQFREFERFTTTAMNAFIGPPVTDYMSRFKRKLADAGVDAELHIMQSNGGIATEELVAEKPVSLLFSGPAAGILGGKWRSGANTPDREANNTITLDVGGTSADIGIVADDEIVEANVRETEIGGYPVMIPMIDIETIGAGGGSIAYVDQGGAFRVGPRSAGAMPGPVCYDRGGTEPTVTDAHVTLGRIREEFFLGGEMRLDAGGAADAVEASLADPLEMDSVEAALGVLDIVNNNMANAIRSKTVQKGRDPGKFTLVAFGGAGPMHAADVARELGVERTLVPSNPGVLSAVGLSTTDLQYDYISTEFTLVADADHDEIQAAYGELVEQARTRLRADGIDATEAMTIEMTADCRYEGQGYELNIPVGADGSLDSLSTIRERFDRAHAAEFGHSFADNAVEIVNERVTGYGELPSSELVAVPEKAHDVERHALAEETVQFRVDGETESRQTPFYDRRDLRTGHVVDGPAIVGEKDSTIIVPPDFEGRVREYGDIELVHME
ncbi:hydantoinase/oxoprolinase family protein [Halorientalis pallida]|uniref:Hydantoinase/oxoprolinase family protein n=1 Tax=Halorientalis pallida TaxID=2479928 RepID=A0A498L080_9EURY|nr:hydantoinase/oxoprolinase family protein [Halorientalis pallida]RXK47913.1 hydantoinase/oxoprolinase family protein [Halorientalis pallida]